jgi:hypothetical protein
MESHDDTSTSYISHGQITIEVDNLPPDERAAYVKLHVHKITSYTAMALITSLIPENEQLCVLQCNPNLITDGSKLALLIKDLHFFGISENNILSFLYLNLDKIKSANDLISLFRLNSFLPLVSLFNSLSYLIHKEWDFIFILRTIPIKMRFDIVNQYNEKISNDLIIREIISLLPDDQKLSFLAKQAHNIRSELNFLFIAKSLPKKDRFEFFVICKHITFSLTVIFNEALSWFDRKDVEQMLVTPALLTRVTPHLTEVMSFVSLPAALSFYFTHPKMCNAEVKYVINLEINKHYGTHTFDDKNQIVENKDSLDTCINKVDAYSKKVTAEIQSTDLYPLKSLIGEYMPLFFKPDTTQKHAAKPDKQKPAPRVDTAIECLIA